MNAKTIISIVFLLLLPLSTLSIARADNIIIGGTGAARGILVLLKKAYSQHAPEDSLVLTAPMGSTGGVKALRHHVLDIAAIARPCKNIDEHAGLLVQELGRTPFILVANHNIPVTSITTTQLAEAYNGSLKFWPNGLAIRVIMRPAKDQDNVIIRQMSARMERAVTAALAREGMIYGYTDSATLDEVERIPGAISTSTLGLVFSERVNVKILALDGVMPSTDSTRKEHYPFFKTLSLVTRQDASPAVKKFIRFTKSKSAIRVLEQHGFWVN